ncbi:MAG TPA: CYTH domain-containing protein [Candidatus Saccharimonadales bacterium]|nr:CYTH domain-containing protein [Candidatus Saccharimonadales bacterium]
MQTEIESKFLDINISKIRAKLRSLGAKLVQPETKMVCKNFDYPDMSLQKINGWVRVRDEGNKITLAYKQLNDRSLTGTKEVNVTVNDFNTTCNFLEAIGLRIKAVQEKNEKVGN